MLNKLKIRSKLISSFILMSIIGIVIGLFGYNGMNSARKAMESMAKVYLPSLETITRIQFLQTDIKANQYGLLNRRYTIEERKYRSNKVQSRMKELDADISVFDSLPKAAEDLGIWKTFVSDLDNWKKKSDTYSQYVDERTEMMVQGLDPKDKKCVALEDKIFNYFNKDVRDAFALCEASVKKVVDMQSQDANGKNLEAGKNVDKTILNLFLIILGGVVFALTVGLWISANINRILKSVLGQIGKIVDDTLKGRLDSRADVDKTNFEFRGITMSVNDILNTLVGYLDNMPAPAMIIDNEFNIQFMNKPGAGLNNKEGIDLVDTKCYDHFKTEDCKTSRCACARTISSGQQTTAETTARPGNLELEISYSAIPLKDNSGKTIGAFEVVSDQTAVKKAMNKAEKINGYQAVEAEKLTDALDKFSRGDLSFRLQTNTADLDTKEAKKLFDSINLAVNSTADSVKALINDANKLAESAVEGKLATRADAAKHMGDFRKIIEGVNNTLDAVVGPLNVAADYVSRISIGDMPPVITEKYNGDFNVIINNLNALINALNKVIENAKLVAAGDLTIDLKRRSENDELNKSFTAMVRSTANIISEFRSASDNISSSSQQMSSTSQQMSQGASEQASSAEEVSSSMEEMAANIQQNTENARQTEKIALNASDGINRINDASDQTLKYMQDIADKVSIIGEIARQTNILALNAAVEAARAGEHGKGFAVVAAEVRKLAERSQVSAVEIDSLTKNSVRATEESGKLLAAIAPEIGKTAKLVQEIAAASIEQNSGADQVNNAIQQLNQVTQQNAAASEEMATSSEELASQAQQLLEMISFFKIESKETAKKSFSPVDMSKANHPNVAHIEKFIQKPHPETKKTNKGVIINMGKDNLDSNYEKF